MQTKQSQGSSATPQASPGKIVIAFFAPNDDDGSSRTLYLVTSMEDGSLLAVIDDREDTEEAKALESTGFDGCVTGLHFYVTGEWYRQYLSEVDPQVPLHKLTRS